MLLRVVLDGRPQPWQRAQGGKTRALFTPTHVRQYQSVLRLAAQYERGDAPLIEGALNLAVRAYIAVPQSWSRKKTAAALAGEIRPISRPDLSNYTKLVEDTFNEVVWRDDSQVVSFDGSGKWYSDRPRLEIEVSEAPAPTREDRCAASPDQAEARPRNGASGDLFRST